MDLDLDFTLDTSYYSSLEKDFEDIELDIDLLDEWLDTNNYIDEE